MPMRSLMGTCTTHAAELRCTGGASGFSGICCGLWMVVGRSGLAIALRLPAVSRVVLPVLYDRRPWQV
jgi:hypothetical protein